MMIMGQSALPKKTQYKAHKGATLGRFEQHRGDRSIANCFWEEEARVPYEEYLLRSVGDYRTTDLDYGFDRRDIRR